MGWPMTSAPVANVLNDDSITQLLKTAKTVAVVGASPDPRRDSHHVMAYLLAHGYRVIPINPRASGDSILGERVYANLAEISGPIEIIDVFRRSDAVPLVVDEVIASLPRLGHPAIWLQLGVNHQNAVERAMRAGLSVVADRCIQIDHGRFLG
jgi:predicted CoA-binding protein